MAEQAVKFLVLAMAAAEDLVEAVALFRVRLLEVVGQMALQEILLQQ